jgi:hypothetical protein
MKRLVFVTLLLVGITITSCKKDKEYCWDCYLEGDPSWIHAQKTFCGLTEEEAKDINVTGFWSYSGLLVPRKCDKQ